MRDRGGVVCVIETFFCGVCFLLRENMAISHNIPSIYYLVCIEKYNLSFQNSSLVFQLKEPSRI